jgi:hypothetical protein
MICNALRKAVNSPLEFSETSPKPRSNGKWALISGDFDGHFAPGAGGIGAAARPLGAPGKRARF